MMRGYTPGPWRAVRKHVCEHILSTRRVSPNTVQYITRPAFASFVEPLGLQVYGPDWKFGIHDQEKSSYLCANARLIAAAPELLEALKSSIAYVAAWSGYYSVAYMERRDGVPHPNHKTDLEKIQAAIAKAEGK